VRNLDDLVFILLLLEIFAGAIYLLLSLAVQPF
jgi:hypothetical protein